ncbi:2-hydroxy-3-oxopropionate reductase [Marinomonas spartinae]|uniref:2-hydroxy-3-oxopropionate reductase n=1 Tax=Marinomonas spartinae TaxID=1792290 RepID=A0A1A8T2R9_9GAMM|nr:NAD(P)-dependent oxidoreductase [Marinomonas spartinae]SBS25642.1 2-hydroxy-3-oxopropionate reductase [Marinomonas spartinae]
MDQLTITFLGLGVMGYPMAGHLAKAGHAVTVYNRSAAKAQKWVNEYSGSAADTPAQAAKNADIVCICVGNDDDVRSVVYGEDGALAGMKQDAILIDHTTTSALLAEELNLACQTHGLHFIDAPVSGGQAGAENGQLTIMCGGDQQTFDKASIAMNAYAKQIQLMGVAGQGQRCKMVNQICIAGVLQGLSEALMLAEASNLDISQVVNTLQHGAAGSWQMANRLATMAKDEFDFGFAIDWMRKDLGIALDEAKQHSLDLTMTHEVDQHYAKLQQQGLGRMDTSVLVKAIKQSSQAE